MERLSRDVVVLFWVYEVLGGWAELFGGLTEMISKGSTLQMYQIDPSQDEQGLTEMIYASVKMFGVCSVQTEMNWGLAKMIVG